MEYVSRVPGPPLDGLVDDLYYLEGGPPYPRLMLPAAPAPLLIVNLGAPFHLRAGTAADAVEYADGCAVTTPTRAWEFSYPTPTRSVGVHCKPWGLAPFLPVPAAALCDRPATVEQIWGRPAAAALRHRLTAADAPDDMLAVLEEELVRRLRVIDGLDLVRHLSAAVAATGGTVPISDLGVAARASSTYRPTSCASSGSSPGSRPLGTPKSGGGSCAITPATSWTAGRSRPFDFVQERRPRQRQTRNRRTEEEAVGKVVLNASVSVDGFIAAENDDPGPIFDWLVSGDVPLDDGGVLKVSQASFDYVRPYWDEVGVTVAGRHAFDITDGWDGTPPSGIDHVVVVSHRGAPEGWDPRAPFHFVDGIDAAVAKARELAGDRTIEFAAGDVGGQALAAGWIDEVRMDVAPVVLGSGKRYFGSVDAQHLLEGPDVVVPGDRVLHLRYRVRR